MSRGRKPGTGTAQARILAALRAAGTDTDGRPKSLRSAELAASAKVNHHSLSKCTGKLLALGEITRCLVQPAIGNKTHEWRIGPGRPPVELKPLDTKRAKVARMTHRQADPAPTPPTRAATTPRRAASSGLPDQDTLQRVQRMSEGEFAEYVTHLARIWAYGVGRRESRNAGIHRAAEGRPVE